MDWQVPFRCGGLHLGLFTHPWSEPVLCYSLRFYGLHGLLCWP